MMAAHRVFTAQNLALIEQMAGQGHSARDIAQAIGSTPSSVRVKCSHRKIRLKRGRGPSRQAVSFGQVDHPRRESGKMPVLAYMPESLFADFSRKAIDLDKSPSVFASLLLTAIASSDLYKAVLDD